MTFRQIGSVKRHENTLSEHEYCLVAHAWIRSPDKYGYTDWFLHFASELPARIDGRT